MAYNAARTLATIAIRASGYRVKHVGGGRYNTFLALPVAMGPAVDTLATYFDTCRQSRNDLSYDAASVVSASDAAELVKRTTQFRMDVTEKAGDVLRSLLAAGCTLNSSQSGQYVSQRCSNGQLSSVASCPRSS